LLALVVELSLAAARPLKWPFFDQNNLRMLLVPLWIFDAVISLPAFI